MTTPKVFSMIDPSYRPNSVDLFANYNNRLLDRFMSWQPDLSAIAVGASMLPLKGENLYCFPLIVGTPTMVHQ